MELTTLNLVLLLIAQGVVSLAMTVGLVALALRGSRQLQDRLLFHSKALNRFAKHVLSDKYQDAMRNKTRELVLKELNVELSEQARNLETREQALLTAQAELEKNQQQLLEQLNARIPSVDASDFEITSAEDRELEEMEQELQSHQVAEQSSALLAEIAELRSSLDRQNAELARLRTQVSTKDVDENVIQLVDAQRKQLEQYQRMQRDMDMCVQVMEQELEQTRQNLQRVVVKLRQQTDRNRLLSDRLAQVIGNQ